VLRYQKDGVERFRAGPSLVFDYFPYEHYHLCVRMKTVRFASVVEACGVPEFYLPLQNPENEKSFVKALKEKRVMTVKQETVGTQKDFGRVGYFKEKNISLLIFPKNLRAYKGTRVVGIKYDLVQNPEPKKADLFEPKKATAQKQPTSKRSKAPETKRYRVTIQAQAVLLLSHEVKAATPKEAEQKALDLTFNEPIDFSKADISTKRIKTQRLS